MTLLKAMCIIQLFIVHVNQTIKIQGKGRVKSLPWHVLNIQISTLKINIPDNIICDV